MSIAILVLLVLLLAGYVLAAARNITHDTSQSDVPNLADEAAAAEAAIRLHAIRRQLDVAHVRADMRAHSDAVRRVLAAEIEEISESSPR